MENQTCGKIKYLWPYNRTKYIDLNFKRLCEEICIQRHFSVCNAPKQNGALERMNISLIERVKSLILNVRLSKDFWIETIYMAYYFIHISGENRPKLVSKLKKCVFVGYTIDVRGSSYGI